MFVDKDKDEATAWYYTLNLRLNQLSGRILFALSENIMDALKYLGLYRFALRMATDPVQTALAIYRRSGVDWTRVVLHDFFVSYDVEAGKIFRFEEEVMPAGRRARGVSATPTSVHLPTTPVVYRDWLLEKSGVCAT